MFNYDSRSAVTTIGLAVSGSHLLSTCGALSPAPTTMNQRLMAADTVLIVDRDADTREILGLALERAGFRTLTEDDGARAITAIDTQTVALVIADLYMPAGGERCLVRAIKQHPRHRQLPVIAYTTRLAPADREWAQRQHCDLMLAKPTSVMLIVNHVRSLLARSAADGAA